MGSPTTRTAPPPGPLDQHRQARPFADCLAAGIDPTRPGGRGIGIRSLREGGHQRRHPHRATMHEVREFAGHADIRTTEVDFVRKEEDAGLAARRIHVTGRKSE